MVTIEIEKTHLCFFLVALVVVVGVGLAVAAVPDPGHPMSDIEGLDTNGDGVPDSANSVPWSGITGMPAGFADGTDNDAGSSLCICTRHLCLDIWTDSQVWRPESCAKLGSWTTTDPCGSGYNPTGAVRVQLKTC